MAKIEFMKWLKSPWVIGLLGVLLYLATTAAVLHRQRAAFLPQSKAALEASKGSTGFWDINSGEVDQLVTELRKEKSDLALREQQLTELSARLQAERGEMDHATQRVWQL